MYEIKGTYFENIFRAIVDFKDDSQFFNSASFSEDELVKINSIVFSLLKYTLQYSKTKKEHFKSVQLNLHYELKQVKIKGEKAQKIIHSKVLKENINSLFDDIIKLNMKTTNTIKCTVKC